MCGICGIVSRQAIDQQTVELMQQQLHHRGPDGGGLFQDKGVLLGHRRLSVIDLAGGDQPIFNEDGSVAVVFNGEIYNYRELRQGLQERGHCFATASDTEVIVHLYEEYGVDCLQQLNGMFAIALWDRRRRQLLLARDRVGVKPLVYGWTKTGFWFASEINALVAAGRGQLDLDLDRQALFEYLRFGYIGAPATVYRGIRKLEPAHYLLLDDTGNTVDSGRYWQLPAPHSAPPLPYPDAVAQLRDLLQDAVARRLISDVPLGALLSGGLDSSLITALMAEMGTGTPKTFAVGFPGQGLLDESAHARRVADYFATDHCTLDLQPQELLAAIPQVLERLGEPFSGGGSLLPTYLVSALAREQVTVALSGDGADELFAGYEKYLAIPYQQLYRRLPRTARQGLGLLLQQLPASRGSRRGELVRKAQRFLGSAALDAPAQHIALMQLCDTATAHELLGDSMGDPQPIHHRLTDDYQRGAGLPLAEGWDGINGALAVDFGHALPHDMLTKVDLASMYNSLEVRSPFLDYRVAELVFALPGSYKMQGRQRKRLLRDAAADWLPDFVFQRRKQGFDLPVGAWFQGELRELFWDTVSSDRGPITLAQEPLKRLYQQHCDQQVEAGRLLWTLFTLGYWSQQQVS